MSSISPITTNTFSLPPPMTAASSMPSLTSTPPSSVTSSLQAEAGVVATLSGSTSTDSSSDDLYTNLANLAVSAGAPGTSSSFDANAAWATVIQNNPAMAPLATQMAATQALLTAVL